MAISWIEFFFSNTVKTDAPFLSRLLHFPADGEGYTAGSVGYIHLMIANFMPDVQNIVTTNLG